MTFCKRIFEIMGNLTIGIYLLFIITILFIVGSYYANLFPNTIGALNDINLYKWLMSNGKQRPYILLWIMSIILSIGLLFINICICTLKRLYFFCKKWVSHEPVSIYKIIPSIIHIMFIVSIIGHGLSMICIYKERYIINIGDEIYLPKDQHIRIIDIKWLFFDLDTKIIRQINVKIKSKDKYYNLSFLHPVAINGYRIFLDINKYNNSKGELILVVVKDVGSLIVIYADLIMTILMTYFFVFKLKKSWREL